LTFTPKESTLFSPLCVVAFGDNTVLTILVLFFWIFTRHFH
jgi:hypothetical protein